MAHSSLHCKCNRIDHDFLPHSRASISRFVSKWLLQIFTTAAACMPVANGIAELQSIRQPTEGRQAIGTGSANRTRRLNGGSFEPNV